MARHLFSVPHRPFFEDPAFNGSFSQFGQLSSHHSQSEQLPVLSNGPKRDLQTTASRVLHSMIESRKDLQVVADFIQKLRTAEDLVSKLGFSLREIQGSRRATTETRKKRAKNFIKSESSSIVRMLRPNGALDSASEDRCR